MDIKDFVEIQYNHNHQYFIYNNQNKQHLLKIIYYLIHKIMILIKYIIVYHHQENYIIEIKLNIWNLIKLFNLGMERKLYPRLIFKKNIKCVIGIIIKIKFIHNKNY